MASQHNLATFYQANTKVLKGWYSNYAKKVEADYPEIFNVFENDARLPYMTLLPIIEFGLMKVKPEGQAPAIDQMTEGNATTFNFVTFSLGYTITDEGREEGPADILQTLPMRLVDAERVTKEYLFSNIFNLAATIGVNGADGVPLLSTAHPLPGLPGQTYSNYAGNTALTPESLQNALVSMRLTPSDRGNPSTRTAETLLVHPYLEKIAYEVTGSDYYPYSQENKINVVKNKVQVKPYRYLTNQLAWFTLAKKGSLQSGDGHSLGISFKYQNRNREKVDEWTGQISQRASFRVTFGFVNWRGVYGSSGA